MANLADELGTNYFSQSMSGAVFLHEGVPCMFIQATGSGMCEVTDILDHENPRAAMWGRTRRVPLSLFESFSTFATPKLGYRNYLSANNINALLRLNSIRSTRRGFRHDTTQVRVITPAHTSVAIPHGASLVSCAFDMNSFLSYQEALNVVRTGEQMGTAMSPDLALVADYSTPGGYMSILFRGQKVADVTEYGDIQRASKSFRTTNHYLSLVKKGEAL